MTIIADATGRHYIAHPSGHPDTYHALPARQIADGAWLPVSGSRIEVIRKDRVRVVGEGK